MSHFDEHDDRRAVRLARDVGDREVLVDEPLARVDEDERDVGAVGGLERAQLGVVLDPLPLRALAAQAGGVDQDERRAVALEQRCRSRRASCPARRRRSRAPRRGSRSAGSTCRRSGGRGSRPGSPPRRPAPAPRPGSRATIASSRSPVPWPCSAGERDRVAEPEPVELERERRPAPGRRSCSRAGSTGLRASRRISATSSSPGVMPGLRVDDEEHEVGLRDRRARLVGDRARDRRPVGDVDAAGVDQQELACPPTRRRAPCGRA